MLLITQPQAIALSSEPYVWRARMRDGTEIYERPDISSDHLPRDDVVEIGYVPTRAGLPTIRCVVKLGSGERFVRYWSTIWRPADNGAPVTSQRIFVAGVARRNGTYALIAAYPVFAAVTFSDHYPFNPSWEPHPFRNVTGLSFGGPGTATTGWRNQDGEGAQVVLQQGVMTFQTLP